ncbi:hypoxanthine-guanine phosphoribosyltransferase [Aquisalimonas sp.]|uniref:hypoxanthine-guanine phosphoribosyltransferase n=1 Tax=unclassified Aquisalimonas TaxID=2644645 RepID=UPI0025C21F19|nr:hypoxanthine-guanine phosphoribosyltransferase [Aquisalimonas sp.]
MKHHEVRAALEGAERIHDGAAVEAALARMAAEITADMADDLPLVLCVMIGGLVPAGRLLPLMNFPLEVDYVHATRYRGETSGGHLHWVARPHTPLKDRTVLIIDDILDEGRTLAALQDYCAEEGAEHVRTAVLVRKDHDRCLPQVRADYIGLNVDDRYVFGAGMDYHGVLRNVDGIYAIREED